MTTSLHKYHLLLRTSIVASIVLALVLAVVPGQQLALSLAAPAPVQPAAVVNAVNATCVTLQPDENASQDAWINQDSPTSNANDSELRVKSESGKLNRSLIRFNLSGVIPTNAKVTSAILSLWVKEIKDGNSTIRAHQLEDFWTENQVTWRYQDKATADEWTTAGGDYASAVLDSETFTTASPNKDYWATFNISAAAQAWAADPAANYGVILESPVTNPKSEVKFKSSADGTAGQRPKLDLCWDIGVNITPNNLAQGTAGQAKIYGHTVTVTDFSNEPVGLTAVSNQGWTVNIYKDVNGNGQKDAGDDPITQTPPIGPNGTYKILVEVVVPANAPNGTKDITTVTATGLNNGTIATAKDTTQIGFPPVADPVLDGRRDLAYTQNLESNTQDYCDAGGKVLARLMTLYDVASPQYVWVILEMDLAHVDNSYGTNTHPSWAAVGKSHTLDNLRGSDKGQLLVRDANGALIFDVTADYVENGRPTVSGWGSAGVTGGEGSVAKGNPNQVAVESSIGYNLNRFCTGSGSCTVSGVNLFQNSPPVNADYTAQSAFFADWQFPYLYEFRFDAAAFGSAGFGSATINNVHVSPNKTGSNEIPVTPCSGSIGDRVWQDFDGDKVQDANEPGLNGVMVNLYKDTGNGTFEPGTDLSINTRFTSGDGDYDFTGLGPGTYFVDVVDSTIPSNYVLTTANEPMKVVLGLGQDFNDADFGYRTLPSIAINKKLVSGAATVGSQVEFSIVITNTGNTVIDVLPLEDFYDPTYLQFVSATPTQSSVSGGVIRWNDLTVGPGNLAVGASMTVTVRFTALKVTAPVARSALDVNKITAEPTVNGLLDPQYSYVGRADPSGNAPGNLYKYIGTSLCYYAFVVDRAFNDNVYATADLPYVQLDGWKKDHEYRDLNNSDLAIFSVSGPSGSYSNMEIDYITQVGNTFIIEFFTSPINDAKTSMWYNMNQSGWNGNGPAPQYINGNPTYHSPPYSWNDTLGQYWEWHMIYEFSIPKSLIGPNCGTVSLAGAHNSPSKNDSTLGSIGDYIWKDMDGQGDQDEVNAGIPNVRVNLYQGTTLVRTTQTEPGTSGYYIFSNLPAGTYRVDVDESTLPVGYSLTTNNEPKTVNLAAGQKYLLADFGYAPGLGSIGDRVYYDINGDGGLDDDNEPGINGVTVNLFQGSCPGSGQPFKTQVTSGNGDYLFDKLEAGTYCVNVDDATLPANYSLTTAPEPRQIVLAQEQDYLLADFGYRVQDAGKSCDVATVIGARDQYGINPGDKSSYACVEIKGMDFGDLPDTTAGTGAGDYQTLLANNGPRHTITDLKLGPTIDGELDGQPNATATGDGADEDGVTIPTLIRGQTATVVVNSSGPGKLNAFFDWNNDGDFNDAGEAIAQLNVVAGNNNLSVPVPATAVTGVNLGARFRLSSAGGLNALGAAADGEVEDYLKRVEAPGIVIEKTTNGASADQPDGADVKQIAPGATVTWQYLITNNGTTNINRSDIAVSDNVIGNLMVAGVVQTLAAPYTGVALVSGAALADNVLSPNESFTLQVTRPAENLGTKDPNANPADQYVVGCRDAITDPDGRTTYKNTGTVTVPGATSSDDSHYCNPPELGSIGNYVWVDENSDGYQDAGEPGIPNVRIHLKNSTGTIIARTWTDAKGGYLFTSLPDATYFVDVDETTLPLGMSQTPYRLPGADFGNQDHSGNGYQVVLPMNGENLTADFGYNYNTTVCVDGDPACNDVTATIGDRVWVDANGNGKQDPAEVGIPGVQVTLKFDPDNDGIYTTAFTVNTDSNGNYLFDGLPPAAYIVQVTPPGGYTQTGDPDQWGVTCTACDNQTTTPVILAPGDVFLNADFGYQPPATHNNSIGDKVWFDLDGDGVGPSGHGAAPGNDNTEPGIPGVTVALIKDVNNDGMWDPDGVDNLPRTSDDEVILGRTTTDGSGAYLFTGLPDGSYLVWVNDTNNILADKVPTYDSNGGTVPGSLNAPFGVASNTVLGISSVLNLGVGSATAVSNLVQDFGYKVPDQDPGEGLIGDRVWLDFSNLGVQDANEPGIEGVRVELRDNTNTVLDVTYTDENGNYYFGGLPAGTYTVIVTPPTGMVQTYDADNATGPFTSPHQSTVTIPAGGVNLLQDFGYRGLGTVGDLVWNDVNGDGDLDGGETGISGVTLDIYWDLNGNEKVDPSEPRLGSTTTDSNGAYLFRGLPTDDGGGNAQFVVDVTDTAAVLNGYVHSLGTPGLNNNSQTDPEAVQLTPGSPNYLAADFGYYIRPAALGNFVWQDSNYNGLQDANEPGLNGVKVTMTAKYANGATFTFVTLTGDDPSTGAVEQGWYSFGNLLLDEDHISSKTGTPTATQPVYTISVSTAPAGYLPTAVDQGANDMTDSDNHAGVDGLATQGQLNVTRNANPNAESNPIAGYDFGYVLTPPYVITKQLRTVDPVRNGEPISFTIRITNTSTVPFSTVPLTDAYDTTYLTFVGSVPATDDQINDGLLNWGDLTQFGTKGFGADLLPGQSFSVIVTFVGRADTTTLPAQSPCTEFGKTCNIAAVVGAKYDPDGAGGVPEQGPLPTKSAWDDVQIMVPTGLDVVDATAGSWVDGITLAWRTVNEAKIVGFNIYRTGPEGRQQLNSQLLPTLVGGQTSGSTYQFTDSSVSVGNSYEYTLETVYADSEAKETYLGSVMAMRYLFLSHIAR